MADLNFLQYYKPIDYLTPMSVAQEMVERNRNAKTQRMFAENQAKRQSAQDLREQQEFESKQEDQKRKDAIENAHILQTVGMLHPTNPGAAEALLNAVGGHLNPLTAATPAAHEPSFDEQLNHELAGAAPEAEGPSSGAGPAGFPKPPEPVYEGPQESPDLEERMQAPKPDAKLEGLMSAASVAPKFEAASYEAPHPSNPLFEAVIGGHHYALPTRAPGTGLGEKYDTLYDHAINNMGMDDKAAREFVLKTFKDDNSASNIATRTADEIKQREQEKENFGDKFMLDALTRQKNVETAEKGRNSRNAENNKARLEAAAMMGGPRQEQADTGKRTQYMGAVKEAKAAAGAGKDIEATKRIDQVLGEIGPGSSSAAQTAALDTVTGLSQGGKAGMGMLKVLNEHVVGSVLDKGADWAYQQTHHGEHSPQWKKSFNSLVDSLREARKNDRQRDIQSFHRAAGLGSQYAKDADLAPYVEDEQKAFAKELGIPESEMPRSGPSTEDQLRDTLKQLRGMK